MIGTDFLIRRQKMGSIAYCRSVEQEIFFQDASWQKTEAEERVVGQLDVIVQQANCLERPQEVCASCARRVYQNDFGMIRLRETTEGEWLDLF